MRKSLKFLLIFLTLTPIATSVNLQAPHVINFNKHQYGGANKNWAIAMDSQGYTYFGNSIGLIEFDGVSWHLYNSLNGFAIRCIAIDKENRIFTGGYRELGYWKRNETGRLEYHSLTHLAEEHFPKNEEFWNVFIIENKVYFQSFSGIYIYSEGQFSVIQVNGFITNATVLNNELLIALIHQGIFKVTGDQYHPLLSGAFFNSKSVTFIDRISENNYLIGTESSGFFVFNTATNQAHPWATNLTESLIRNNINKAIHLKDGHTFVGTILDGIKILDSGGKLTQSIDIKTGLQSNTVHAMKCDRLGNIWVASDKGLDFVSFSSSGSYSIFRHPELGAVYSAALYDGMLYAGTNQGLFRREWLRQNERFELVPGTQRQVWDCDIIDNKIFVGHNSGTFLIDDHKPQLISNHAGGYSITQIPERPNHLLQSTYSDLVVFTKENGHWKANNIVKGFSDLIRFVEFDHRNNLWASHRYQGIYKIRLNEALDSAIQVTHFSKNSNIWRQGASIRTFSVENRIVFTNEEQIYTYDDLKDSIVPYAFLNNHLGDYSSSFLISGGPDHHYWFMNSSGIALFRILGTDVEKIREFPIALFRNEMIPREENLIPLHNRKALLCLENGYAVLDADIPESGSRISGERLHLREIKISGQSGKPEVLSPFTKKPVIPHGKNNLILRYSFPLFSSEKISYQYKVSGLIGEWSAPTSQPRFVINRIPPGEYTISVRATNNWGHTSEIHKLPFRVKPPWYQSSLAFVIYALVFAGLFFLGKHITIKRVKLNEKHKREEKERELIQLRNDKLQSELSFKSRQLANSTMGIIKKNEFLISLKEKLKRHKEQLGTRYPDKYYNELTKKIDSNITGDDDWKMFEYNFNLAHESFLQSLKNEYPDLTPSDLRLCAFLRINLTSKEIAPLLGISVRGVENHRYRVRKKLNLSGDTDLTEFILTFQDGNDHPN
ncbi:triple tyrosine motif-containing protein [Marinilabilia sp.]|uniref:triple tyrosine motif-containing protein n=1 Tax=Marinilabilia sp. TaxID=2021252 RepID=UPI0025BF126A|nr:triple tyrosine motif-containing protein [Marinilabilia sp.]